MEKLYEIGPVILALRDLPVYKNWPFRDWKLDPFSTAGKTANLTVCYDSAPVAAEGAPVTVERSLRTRRERFVLPDGRTLWQQLRSEQIELQMVLSADGRTITVTRDETNTCGIALLEALSFLIFHAMLGMEVLSFHGAVVEYQGKGLLLVGQSGAGKTTHARLWRDHKHALILNGDRASCYKRNGGWTAFGSPWCGTSGEYLNRQVPVRAMVVLRQSGENRVSVLTAKELLQSVLPVVVYPSWDRALTEKMLSLLDDFLEAVPALQLECRADTSAVDLLDDYLEKLQ